MHLQLVFHVLSVLVMALAAAMLTALPFSFYFRDGAHLAILVSALLSGGTGASVYFLTRVKGPVEQDLRPREGFAVVALGWLVAAAFGSLPFLLSGAIPAVTDAFFETMSGFTTTGATILKEIEQLPHSILYWRSLTHWLGGMGIVVLSIAILPFLGVGGMQMFKAEAPGPVADKLTPRIAETAKILWGVYVLFSALETGLLMLGGMNFFEALCHTFGTMATGGFSTRNASIGAYGSAFIDYVVVLFMILAGANFSLHYRFMKGDWRAYWRNAEFKFYLSLLGLATLLIAWDVLRHQPVSTGLGFRQALFQATSIMTTTGYGTADYEQWSSSSQYILFTLMFIGGCAGSTGGGMKVIRLLVLLKIVFAEIKRLIHPRAVVPVQVGRRPVPPDVLTHVMGFFVLYILLFATAVWIMAALGLDLISALGSVAACLGNIGPGLGSVGPTDNYAHIPLLGKWVLFWMMLLGRLEIFTVVILFTRAFWEK
ncbi:MAG: TrkH family potassium uptake protein [Calditrichaeota bacterium]|nr:MAG: TrkH family potassium uptake protein [Calditrichota bacterium]